jgi:hypothetical protein
LRKRRGKEKGEMKGRTNGVGILLERLADLRVGDSDGPLVFVGAVRAVESVLAFKGRTREKEEKTNPMRLSISASRSPQIPSESLMRMSLSFSIPPSKPATHGAVR